MRDEFDVSRLIRNTSKKWTDFPGTIGMHLAEMDYGVAPEIRDCLIHDAEAGTLGYVPAVDGAALREATASYLAQFGPAPDTERIGLLPDVLSALSLTLDTFLAPGAPVVVPTPAYAPFLSLPALHGHPIVEVPSLFDVGMWHLDLDGLRAALTKDSLLILCNPWNPVGRSLTRTELEEVATLIEATGARVFEDNIHAPLTLSAPFCPFAPLTPTTRARTVSAISASKGWNIAGLKCAQVVFHNPDDAARAGIGNDCALVGARASVVAYRDCEGWIAQVQANLRENARMIEERVAHWPGVTAPHVEATYITWLDFSGAANRALAEHPADYLREHAKVSLSPGQNFGRGYEQSARMIFATTQPVLNDALDRIEKALRGQDSPAIPVA